MRGCEAVVVELPGYVGGKLDSPAAVSVQRHLQACASCQSELRQVERLEQLLAVGLPSISPSPGFASSFANRLAQEIVDEGEERHLSARSFLSWLARPWLAPVGVAAVLALIMVTVFWPFGSEPPGSWPVRIPGVSSGGAVASNPKKAVPDTKLAAKPSEKKIMASNPAEPSNPPADLIARPDLFVDYAVINDLDQIDSDKAG
jgi:anti-sigma factor RsiW